MQLDVAKYLYFKCRCDVTTSSSTSPTRFPNPIQYRSFKIAASLIPTGMRLSGGWKPEEGWGNGMRKVSERDTNIGKVAMRHYVKWLSLCLSDSFHS
jgi:hypothetical protein